MNSAAILYAFDNPRQHADLVMEDEAKVDSTLRLIQRYRQGNS